MTLVRSAQDDARCLVCPGASCDLQAGNVIWIAAWPGKVVKSAIMPQRANFNEYTTWVGTEPMFRSALRLMPHCFVWRQRFHHMSAWL